MWGILQRAVHRLRRGHYSKPPVTRPTERRARAAEVMRCIYIGHPDYALLRDYVDGMTIESIAAKYHMSESTVGRRINAMVH